MYRMQYYIDKDAPYRDRQGALKLQTNFKKLNFQSLLIFGDGFITDAFYFC